MEEAHLGPRGRAGESEAGLRPVLLVLVDGTDDLRADRVVDGIPEAACGNPVVLVRGVVEEEMQARSLRQPGCGRHLRVDPVKDLVDLGRLLIEVGGELVVAAALLHESAARVVEAHVQPHAATFPVSGGQLVAHHVRDPDAQVTAVHHGLEVRGRGQHRRIPRHGVDDRLLGEPRVGIGVLGADRAQNPGIRTREGVPRDVGAHRRREVRVATRPERVGHVAVLTRGHRGLVAAEPAAGLDRVLRIDARSPLAEGPLDGEHVLLPCGRVGGVQVSDLEAAVLLLLEQRVRDVMAGGAHQRLLVERRLPPLVEEEVDQLEGSATVVVGVDDERTGVRLLEGGSHQASEDRGVVRRVLRVRHGVDHAVAEVAVHPVQVTEERVQ